MNALPRILTAGFILFWTLFLFLDYWQKHPGYYYSFAYFQYWGLAATLLAVGGGVVWAVKKFGADKRRSRFFNGTAVFLLFLFVSVVSVGAAYRTLAIGPSFDVPRMAGVLGKVGGTALAVLFITTASYVLGSFINAWLRLRLTGLEAALVDVAAGLFGLVTVCFLLASVSLLHSFILYPALAVLFFFGRKKAWAFLKNLLWAPLATDKQLNWWGAGSFYLLTVLFSINFTAVNVPMPAGFDSLTLYANLPRLIGNEHSLIEGFQPYNWSILMSLGYVLFGSTTVSLALSYLGGLLAAFALYALSRKWLKIDANNALLAVLVFSLTPVFTIQSYAELKIDLGLLYISLCILLVMLGYLGRQVSPQPAAKPAAAVTGFWKNLLQESPEIVWMGLLSGFAIGIKLTTVYFVFSLLAVVWFAFHGGRGFWAIFLASLFLVLLAKLDDFGGLRQFHLGAGLLQWAALGASGLLLVGAYLANRAGFLKTARHSIIYGVLVLAVFLPWGIKNYSETKSLSPAMLMNGKAASPNINLEILEKNLGQHGN